MPTVWLCNDRMIRFVRCRPFQPGDDAVDAISRMRLIPRLEQDWAEFWAWERDSLSQAVNLGPRRPAIQTLRHVILGEMELGSQEFDTPANGAPVFLRHTSAKVVHGPDDLPAGLREIIYHHDPEKIAGSEPAILEMLRDRGYPIGIAWQATD